MGCPNEGKLTGTGLTAIGKSQIAKSKLKLGQVYRSIQPKPIRHNRPELAGSNRICRQGGTGGMARLQRSSR